MAGIMTSIELNDKMSTILNNIVGSTNNLIEKFNNVDKTIDKTFSTKDIDFMNKQIKSLDTSYDILEQKINNASNSQNNFNNKVNVGSGSVDKLVGTVKRLAGAYLGLQGIKGAASLSDEYTQTNARLNIMNDGLQTTEELQKKIFAAAERSRGSYQGMADSVAKLGLTAKKSFSSNDEMIKFAELMNKQFVVGGAGAQEQASAMYQLTQAMASGRLQGDEFRSIIENAPLLAKSIEDYMKNVKNVQGTMKDWASEGLLTANVIKAALFESADDINEKFNEMPMTWGQVVQSIKNKSLIAFNPILQKINELANNEKVQNFANNTVKGVALVANALLKIFELASNVANFFASNWSIIEPIIMGIAFAMAAYNAALLLNNIYTGIVTAAKTTSTIAAIAHGAAITAEMTATTGLTSAQLAFNAALYACPLTWILLAIIAIIAIIYVVIAVINKVKGTAISATGGIIGSLAAAGAFIWDLLLGVLDLVLGCINFLANSFSSFANFIANIFNDPIASIIHAFGDMADRILGILESIAKALDKVFGSNLAGAVSGWRSGLSSKIDAAAQKYGNGKYKKVVDDLNLSSESLGLSRISYSGAFNKGYNAGSKIDNKIGSIFKKNGISDDFMNSLDTTAGNTGNIADDTGNISKSLDKSKEDLKYLRDIAEQEAINRFTTAEIKVEMTNNNNISSDSDLDGIINTLVEGVTIAMEETARGV